MPPRRIFCFHSGFSLTEMLVGIVFSLFLFGFAYRFFTANFSHQYEEAGLTRLDHQVREGIDRLRSDFAQMDSNWFARSVVPISFQPESEHPGEPGDWITILLPESTSLPPLQFQSDTDPTNLYQTSFHAIRPVNDSTSLTSGDYILVYRPGQYSIAKVGGKQVDALGQIVGLKFNALTSSEKADPSHPGVVESRPNLLSTFAADSTLIQKVRPVSYHLVKMNMGGKSTTYLSRFAGGAETILAPLDQLTFAFDVKGLLTTSRDVTSVASWGDVIAIKVGIRGKTAAGRESGGQARVMLPGASAEATFSNGKIDVVPSGQLSTKSVGQVALERYPSGLTYLVAPLIQFGSTPSASAGEVIVINADSGQAVGSAATLTDSSGNPFLPTVAASLKGYPKSPGIVLGGYREVGGVMSPGVMFIGRDSQGYPNLSSRVFSSLGTGVAGLYDSVSVASLDRRGIYIASYAKDGGAGAISIYRAPYLGSGAFGTPSLVYSDAASGSALITAMGEGPRIAGRPYLAFCQTNTSDGNGDGKCRLIKQNSDGTLDAANPVTVATTDWQANGVQSNNVGIYVAGRLSAKAISITTLRKLLQGVGLPPALNLDDKTISGASTVYPDAYDVTNIKPGSPVAARQISWLTGLSLSLPDTKYWITHLAVADGGNSASKSVVYSDIENIGYKGVESAAEISGILSNLNASAIKTAHAPGTLFSPSDTLPPGTYRFTGTPRTAPSPQCWFPRPGQPNSGVNNADWFGCIARKFGVPTSPGGAASPTPTPNVTDTPTPTPTPKKGGGGKTTTPTATPTPTPSGRTALTCRDEQCPDGTLLPRTDDGYGNCVGMLCVGMPPGCEGGTSPFNCWDSCNPLDLSPTGNCLYCCNFAR